MLIIDCHCHFGTGDGLNGPWDTRANLEKYLIQAEEAGIQKTNLFSVFHSDYAAANFKVAKIIRANPDRFFGFAFVNPLRDTGRVYKMVERAVKSYGFCGIKVHRHDGRITREICETAKAFSLPVLYDVMGEISVIELLAEEYPDVNFIIPHLGSFADDWKAQVGFCRILRTYRNIFTDTSGVRRFDVLEMALNDSGPEKILFGSDGPWLHPGVELAKVFALKMPQSEIEMVVSRNFIKLISSAGKTGKVQAGINFKHPLIQQEISTGDPWLPKN